MPTAPDPAPRRKGTAVTLPEPVSARRWKYVILSIGLVLPLIGFGGTAVIAFSGSVSPAVKDAVTNDMRSWVLGYPLTVVAFNWPFYVLSRIVAGRIKARWPNVSSLHWAAAGALIGLCVPYIFGYFRLPYEMTSGATDAGQGVGIFLGVLAPIGGGALAFIGWFVGVRAYQLGRKAST